MDHITRQYQDEYFNWQRKVGSFGGKANLFKFKKHIQSSDSVLDYGCGGGFLLEQLDCNLKVGLDINPVIQAPKGVRIFRDFDEVIKTFGPESFDVVISNHALEHMDSPATALQESFSLLKPGGKIVIVVPSETHKIKFREGDINKHILTFSPMNLGNLLTISGFKVIQVKRLFHKWPPKYDSIAKFNFNVFHFASFFYGSIKRNSIQLIAVAIKLK